MTCWSVKCSLTEWCKWNVFWHCVQAWSSHPSLCQDTNTCRSSQRFQHSNCTDTIITCWKVCSSSANSGGLISDFCHHHLHHHPAPATLHKLRTWCQTTHWVGLRSSFNVTEEQHLCSDTFLTVSWATSFSISFASNSLIPLYDLYIWEKRSKA